MDCPHEHDLETAEHYARGTLPEPEQSAFEGHFFTCECCLADVRALQDLWQVMAAGRPTAGKRAVHPASTARPRWEGWMWAGLAVAASIGAGLIALNVIRPRLPAPSPEVAARVPQSGGDKTP